MNKNLKNRLYISTMGENAPKLAVKYDLGLEISDFVVATNISETFEPYGRIGLEKINLGRKMTFHFPYAELSPCAIEPLVRDVAKLRHKQAFDFAYAHGIKKMVVHSGYIPIVYYPEWYVSQSMEYWKEFLLDKPSDALICVENVMDSDPYMLRDIVDGVCDPRLKICLDVGHASHRVSKTDIMLWIEVLAERISHVHLHNNDRDYDFHSSLGDGLIEMEKVIHQILDFAPKASFATECHEPEKSILWLYERGFLE